jgi:hypothetical protein
MCSQPGWWPVATAFSVPIGAAIGASLIGHLIPAVAAALQSAVLLGIGGPVLGGAAALLADKPEKPFADELERGPDDDGTTGGQDQAASPPSGRGRLLW